MRSLVTVLGLLLTANAAGWDPPPIPEIEVIQCESQTFFLRKLNREKIIEIRKSDDLEVIWTAFIPDYSEVFSELVLSRDGNYLAHVFGNHQIETIEQECIQIYNSDGLMNSHRLMEFHADLQEIRNEHPFLGVPTYTWNDGVGFVFDDRFVLKLNDSRKALVYFSEENLKIIEE